MKGIEPSSSEPQPDVLTVELHSPKTGVIIHNTICFCNHKKLIHPCNYKVFILVYIDNCLCLCYYVCWLFSLWQKF